MARARAAEGGRYAAGGAGRGGGFGMGAGVDVGELRVVGMAAVGRDMRSVAEGR